MSPTTLLISECADPFFHETSLTPTIPVRKNSLGNFLSVTFYLPKGLWLVNKGKCSVQLEGTKPVTIKVGATCTMLYGLKKFSVITPKITNSFQSKFWGVFSLPTILVCICDYYLFASIPLLSTSSSPSYRDHHHHQKTIVVAIINSSLFSWVLPPLWMIWIIISSKPASSLSSEPTFPSTLKLNECAWIMVDELANLALNCSCFAT